MSLIVGLKSGLDVGLRPNLNGDSRLLPSPENLAANGAGTSTADAAAFATGAITPPANRPVILWVSHQGAVAPQPTVTSNAGLNLAWTAKQSVIIGSRRVTAFEAPGLAAPGSGTVQIDFAGNVQSAIIWRFASMKDAPASGSCVVQAPAGTTNGSSLSLAAPALAPLEHPNNLNLAVFIGAVNQDIVPDADFAELDDQNVLTSVIRMETEWARNQRDCTATWAALQQCAALAIEVKAA